jgi:hypothetical protein
VPVLLDVAKGKDGRLARVAVMALGEIGTPKAKAAEWACKPNSVSRRSGMTGEETSTRSVRTVLTQEISVLCQIDGEYYRLLQTGLLRRWNMDLKCS